MLRPSMPAGATVGVFTLTSRSHFTRSSSGAGRDGCGATASATRTLSRCSSMPATRSTPSSDGRRGAPSGGATERCLSQPRARCDRAARDDTTAMDDVTVRVIWLAPATCVLPCTAVAGSPVAAGVPSTSMHGRVVALKRWLHERAADEPTAVRVMWAAARPRITLPAFAGRRPRAAHAAGAAPTGSANATGHAAAARANVAAVAAARADACPRPPLRLARSRRAAGHRRRRTARALWCRSGRPRAARRSTMVERSAHSARRPLKKWVLGVVARGRCGRFIGGGVARWSGLRAAWGRSGGLRGQVAGDRVEVD